MPQIPADLEMVFRRDPDMAHVSHRAYWPNLAVEEIAYAPGARTVPPLDHHLVTLHLGPAVLLHQERAGQSSDALHSENAVTITPARESDSRNWQSRCHAAHFWLKHDHVTAMAQESFGGKTIAPPVSLRSSFLSEDDKVVRIATLLLDEARRDASPNDASDTLYVESLRNALTAHLIRSYGSTASADEAAVRPLSSASMDQLQHFIEEHLDHDLTLESLAQIAAISPFHLARRFKAATGSTLHQYVVTRRVEAAKRLLLNEEATASQAAYEVGFGSQSLLNRHFKRITGTTPAAYARTMRASLSQASNTTDLPAVETAARGRMPSA